MERVIAWFSCGAASAVAAKMAIRKYKDQVLVVNCDTMGTEHLDNQRFFEDVQKWLGVKILQIKSTEYKSIDDVFEARKYLAGNKGAPCTVEMKKIPRFKFQEPDDVHVFGYTLEESVRIERFTENNPELLTEFILHQDRITKTDCVRILDRAGIALPVMYGLGFKNNNCLGCVKASSPAYWELTRRHFPEIFERRAEQSRRFGARLVRIKGVRRFLDELPEMPLVIESGEDVSCGPQCTA